MSYKQPTATITVVNPRSSRHLWKPRTQGLARSQAAIGLSEEQQLEIAALTRTMIAQLSALSQRHKALEDLEADASVTSPMADRGRDFPETKRNASDPRNAVLRRRCSPRSAALRVSQDAGLHRYCAWGSTKTLYAAYTALVL